MEYTEEYIDLKQYWLIIRRRWLPATLVTTSVIALTAVLTFWQKPIYQAEGQVLLKKTSGVPTSSSSSSAASGDAIGVLDSLSNQGNPVSTEIQIIESDPIVDQVIQDLRLAPKVSLMNWVKRFITRKAPSDSSLMRSEDFLNNLTAINTKDTDIIAIQYESTDPKEAMAVVNKIIDLYKARNIASTREQAAAARKFIETQLPKANREVQRYTQALREFKERSKVVSLPDEARMAVENAGDLQKTLTTTQVALADVQTRTQALRNQIGLSPQSGLQVNALSQSPAVQKALTDLQDVQRNLATARTQLQPGHPQIQDLEEKESALKALLSSQVGQVVGASLPSAPSLSNLQAGQTQQTLTESLVQAEVQRLGLQNQVDMLRQAQTAYRQRMTILPRLEQIQGEIERQLNVAQATYEGLLKSLQVFTIQESQSIGNVDVIERPTLPDQPISPKVLLNLAIGTVLGLLLGVGVVLLLEVLDKSVKTVKEAQDIFDVTVLGTIPAMDGQDQIISRRGLDRIKPQLPVRDDPRSAVSEAYRMLQANLKFLSSDCPPRIITLTSAVPQEGKSTSTANLALVLAEMGYRVLIVDADLRRPSQHQIWELPNAVGLTNILVESGKWSNVIRSENEYLEIITSGVIPPSPGRLIASQRMDALIKEWREVYDYVLIDTPPLAVAADALLISQMTDGILMVARPGVLDAPSAESAKASLAKLDINDDKGEGLAHVLGLVVNGVKPENEPDSYYYYYAKNYYSDLDPSTIPTNGKISVEPANQSDPSSRNLKL